MQHDVIFTKTSTFAVSNYGPSRQCTGIELMFNGGLNEFVITPLNKDRQPAACRIGLPIEDIDALIEGLQKLKDDHEKFIRISKYKKQPDSGLKPYEEVISRMEFENGLWVLEIEKAAFSRKFTTKPPYEKGDVVNYQPFLTYVDKLK